tara:strand:- start:3603 stop:4238 length:636 start_codon:yes stop_codon:yes gene_type:complete
MKIQEWIVENLNDDSVIIEAGAASGTDTLWFGQNFPNGRIFAFEPLNISYDKTVQRVATCDNVKVYNVALGPQESTEELYVSSNGASSSLLKPTGHIQFHPRISFENKSTVKTINLDNFLRGQGVEEVDLMWLDMQGYEHTVLSHSLETLSKTRYLYTEVSLKEMYADSVLYNEFKSWLKERGFKVLHEFLYWEDMGNVLFYNENLDTEQI